LIFFVLLTLLKAQYLNHLFYSILCRFRRRKSHR